jgi:hypothetical protein
MRLQLIAAGRCDRQRRRIGLFFRRVGPAVFVGLLGMLVQGTGNRFIVGMMMLVILAIVRVAMRMHVHRVAMIRPMTNMQRAPACERQCDKEDWNDPSPTHEP